MPLSVFAGNSIALVFFAVCVSVESAPIVVQLAAATCCLAYPPKLASVTCYNMTTLRIIISSITLQYARMNGGADGGHNGLVIICLC